MDRRFWLGMARDWGIALAIALVVLLAWNLLRPSPVKSGAEAPDLPMAVLGGDTKKLSDHRGQVVVLNFWATWCGPCVAEIPEFVAFNAKHPDVQIYGISVDHQRSAEYVKSFATTRRVQYPIVIDTSGDLQGKYGVDSFPTTFIVDEQGNVKDYHTGALNAAQLEEMVFGS